MPDQNPDEPLFEERRFLYPAEIAALFWKLQKPYNEESERIQRAQLDAAQKSANALFMLTGDGQVKGQLPMILDELAAGKKRDMRISRRVKQNEQRLEQYHAENKLARAQDRQDHDAAMKKLNKDIRAIRRNQLWIVRKFRSAYDWCTEKDGDGRYSRAKLSAFALSMVAAEEFARHWYPIVWHKLAVVAHAIRM